jgi:hypothetical protein
LGTKLLINERKAKFICAFPNESAKRELFFLLRSLSLPFGEGWGEVFSLPFGEGRGEVL